MTKYVVRATCTCGFRDSGVWPERSGIRWFVKRLVRAHTGEEHSVTLSWGVEHYVLVQRLLAETATDYLEGRGWVPTPVVAAHFGVHRGKVLSLLRRLPHVEQRKAGRHLEWRVVSKP